MKIGITFKLFLAILLSCALVAVAVSAAYRYSFSKGFLGYLNEQESQRVEMLRPSMIKAYKENGSWDFLRGNPRAWFSLIRPPGSPPAPDEARTGARRTPPESDLTGLNLRVSLLDEQKQVVIGNPRPGPGALMTSIDVDGKVVGWLTLVPFQQVSTGAALRFQEQQFTSSWIIGGLAILLAALVAWLLAQMFLAPLKRIAASTHRLATGDYKTRVKVSTTDELGTLAGDFNQLALTLEKNEQLRRAFMADVSHELRTPLSVLKGELEAIEDGVRPMAMEMIKSLQSEVAILGKLVDDLYELSLSDVGALTYRKERIDVIEVLRMTLPAFQDKLAHKHIRLDMQIMEGEQAFCNADPDRLRQLFANILENAVRYTDAGGIMQIGRSRNSQMITLDFQDTKPGVPEEMLPHLFERFYRVDPSRSRASGGTGLGLAISRNIVEAHHGTMAARTSELGGLWISVCLPLAGAVTP
ncbi:MAG: sensor histidine kinase efflux regulator BaeS [Pseudomonadota bacterium]